MPETYTTGEWYAKPGEEEAFMDAWREFAAWGATKPGAGTLHLTRDLAEPSRFVSFGGWRSVEQAHAWKADPEFPERMRRVQQHVAAFHPHELVEVRTAGHVSTG